MKSQLLAVALALGVPAAAAACAPPTLTGITVRDITPDLPAGDWRREPKVIHRQGDQKARVDEARDPQQKLHLSIVVDEPDIWFVNHEDRTGRHIVDPGPSFVAHVPIISDPEGPPALAGLQFACEARFVRENALPVVGETTIDGQHVRVHAFDAGPHRVEIALAHDGRPLQVGYYRSGRPLQIIRYVSYRSDLPARPELFARPEGFTYTEQPSPPPASAPPQSS